MKKALLIGNGFTLKLINEYSNQVMMDSLHKRIPDLIDRIENEFSVFRNLLFKDSELHTISEALFLSDNLYCSDNLYPSDDGVHITSNSKTWIVEKLKKLGYPDPNKKFYEYFETYGLVYSINKEKITGIETYLKVVALFNEIGRFTKEEYIQIKQIANEIYFNNGNHGKASITNPTIDINKLDRLLEGFVDVFTTNYDTILDDFLEEHNRLTYHLHGGFSINHRNKDPDGRYGPSDARLIWGINAEEKFNDLKVGFDYGDINYGAFRYGQSRLADYFDFLQKREYDEIHILGFSGENDTHINSRIINNPHIKNVLWYVNPCDVSRLETQVRSRLLFGGGKKPVQLRTWDEFWKQVEV